MSILLSNLKDFGYLVLRNALQLSNAEEHFDSICQDELGFTLKDFEKVKKLPLLTMPLEKHLWFLESLGLGGLNACIGRLFPHGDFYFWGSDFSSFRGSSSWHRDIASRFPIFKCLIYLNGAYGEDQKFELIPGSNHIRDSYSLMLARGFGWPKSGKIDAHRFVLEADLSKKSGVASIPSQSLRIQRGDIIVFDQRVWHTVTSSNMRRLITLSFVPGSRVFNTFWEGIETVTPQSYDEHLLLTRTAARFLEKRRLSSYLSSHQGLNLGNTWLGPYLFFDQHDESYFQKLEDSVFGEGGESRAWSYLNVT